MTGPAVVCWGAHLGWLKLAGSRLAFLGMAASVAVFSLFAIGGAHRRQAAEDSQPHQAWAADCACYLRSDLRRRAGAFCGTGAATVALLGGCGGVVGAFAGYHVRQWLTAGRGLPDFAIALLEDLIAVGGGLWIVSRF